MRLWEANGNRIEGNHLESVRDLVVWYSDGDHIADNTVTGSRYGTHLMHTSGNTIVGNRYEHDVVGVFVMYSEKVLIEDVVVTGANGAAGVGLGFKDSDAVTVLDSHLVGNTTGMYIDHTPQ